MTYEVRPLTPEHIREIEARARDARAAFLNELVRSGYVRVKGWLSRKSAKKPSRHRGPLAGANA